jgi:hypothetical protein
VLEAFFWGQEGDEAANAQRYEETAVIFRVRADPAHLARLRAA